MILVNILINQIPTNVRSGEILLSLLLWHTDTAMPPARSNTIAIAEHYQTVMKH